MKYPFSFFWDGSGILCRLIPFCHAHNEQQKCFSKLLNKMEKNIEERQEKTEGVVLRFQCYLSLVFYLTQVLTIYALDVIETDPCMHTAIKCVTMDTYLVTYCEIVSTTHGRTFFSVDFFLGDDVICLQF